MEIVWTEDVWPLRRSSDTCYSGKGSIVETVVALREEIQDKDLSTNILEATSATMRSLLTAFGK